MKNLIIKRVYELQKEKQDLGNIPSSPNELELRKDISAMLNEALESLIEEGHIKVIGITINGLRILNIP